MEKNIWPFLIMGEKSERHFNKVESHVPTFIVRVGHKKNGGMHCKHIQAIPVMAGNSDLARILVENNKPECERCGNLLDDIKSVKKGKDLPF